MASPRQPRSASHGRPRPALLANDMRSTMMRSRSVRWKGLRGGIGSPSIPWCRARGRCCSPAMAAAMTWCSVSPYRAGPPNSPKRSARSGCSSTRCRCASQFRRHNRSRTGCATSRPDRPNCWSINTRRSPTCSAGARCRPARRCSTASWRSRIIRPRWRPSQPRCRPSASPTYRQSSGPIIR